MRLLNLFADIAQVILIVIIFPLISWMFDLSSILNFLQGIPIFDTWLYILMTVNKVDTANILMVAINSFFEAIIMGFCIHLFIKIGDILNARGNLPILASFLGIGLASILIRILSVTGAFQLLLYIAIMAIGIFLMIKGTFRSVKLFSLIDALRLLVESLLAVIACGLVVALTLFSNGSLPFKDLLVIIGLTIVASVITFAVTYERPKIFR